MKQNSLQYRGHLLPVQKLTCADNTGARIVQIVSVIGYHGVRTTPAQDGTGRSRNGDSQEREHPTCAGSL